MCDICISAEEVVQVSVDEMRRIVGQGFDPFKKGLLNRTTIDTWSHGLYGEIGETFQIRRVKLEVKFIKEIRESGRIVKRNGIVYEDCRIVVPRCRQCKILMESSPIKKIGGVLCGLLILCGLGFCIYSFFPGISWMFLIYGAALTAV